MIPDDGGPVQTKYFPAGWNAAAKPCDYCKSTAALLFCRADSAFLCISCDARAHDVDEKTVAVNHGRVWMCDVCEQAPAAVTCKADAAALCYTCDRDIHSANPLARRHERAPVVPFYDTAESMVMKSAGAALLVPGSAGGGGGGGDMFSDGKVENSPAQNGFFPDSWISGDPIITTKLEPDMKSLEFLFSDLDPILDFDNYQICSQSYSDSVVPVQTTMKAATVPAELTHQQSPESRFEIDFTRSSITSYTGPSLSHSVSSSSMDVGVVPDGAAISDTSYSFGKTDSQVVGMDREARVMRYKEKRKNRKFEKTIRYASRRAYAETRPRIKGRFAKRTEFESDL